MKNLLPRLMHWCHRRGWAQITGTLLLIAAILFFLNVTFPAQHELRLLEGEATATTAKRRPAWNPHDPQATMQHFYRVLPAEREIYSLLEKIFDAAYENNVAMARGQFKLKRETNAAFSVYEMELPARGKYADIRKFANQVLGEMPTLALDGISFTREGTGNADIDANVKFALYLRAPV